MILRSFEHLTARVHRLGLVRPLRTHVQALQALPRCLQVLQQLSLAADGNGGASRCAGVVWAPVQAADGFRHERQQQVHSHHGD